MNGRNSGYPLRNLSVSYHYAIKRILGLPKNFSNHYACSLLGRLKFKLFMHFRMLRFCIWVVNTNSSCFVKYRTYFLSSFNFYKFVSEIFLTEHGVRNVIDSDVHALRARFEYVENNEVSSMYGVPMWSKLYRYLLVFLIIFFCVRFAYVCFGWNKLLLLLLLLLLNNKKNIYEQHES